MMSLRQSVLAVSTLFLCACGSAPGPSKNHEGSKAEKPKIVGAGHPVDLTLKPDGRKVDTVSLVAIFNSTERTGAPPIVERQATVTCSSTTFKKSKNGEYVVTSKSANVPMEYKDALKLIEGASSSEGNSALRTMFDKAKFSRPLTERLASDFTPLSGSSGQSDSLRQAMMMFNKKCKVGDTFTAPISVLGPGKSTEITVTGIETRNGYRCAHLVAKMPHTLQDIGAATSRAAESTLESSFDVWVEIGTGIHCVASFVFVDTTVLKVKSRTSTLMTDNRIYSVRLPNR